MKKLFLIIAMLFVTTFTMATDGNYFQDGNWLYKNWKSFQAVINRQTTDNIMLLESGYYVGYVTGVFDAYESYSTLDYFDDSESILVQQLCYVVGAFLEKHPEYWAKPANLIIIAALKEAFPIK